MRKRNPIKRPRVLRRCFDVESPFPEVEVELIGHPAETEMASGKN